MIRFGLLGILLGSVFSNNSGEVAEPRQRFGLGEVRSLAVSPDLRFLATAGQGGAFIWDASTAKLLHRLETEWSVTAMSFSPQSDLLLTASGGNIIAWNPETAVSLKEFRGHRREISSLVFANDGKSFVSAGADNTARIWSVQSGDETQSVRTPGSSISKAVISPDGKTLVTIDSFLTNCVKSWDVATGMPGGVLPKTNWTAQNCIFTRAGQLVVTAPDRSVTLWEIQSTEPLRSFAGITGATAIVVDLWLPNEATLAAAINDGRVYLWNLEHG